MPGYMQVKKSVEILRAEQTKRKYSLGKELLTINSLQGGKMGEIFQIIFGFAEKLEKETQWENKFTN